jgi:hypothetical protein
MTPDDTGVAASAAVPTAGAPSSTALRQVVTANRLRDGVPVYFVGDGHWSLVVAEAQHVAASAAESLLAAAQGGPPPHPVVAPYLIDAVAEDGNLRPLSLRERIRAYGPTVSYSGG